MDQKFMQAAIETAIESAKTGGGPFGAIIVKDGQVIATATNQVTTHNDPTGHAEVNAIREACKKFKTFSLEGCDIYTSCEPCPMCLGAIYWARLKNIYYSGDRGNAKGAGFDDQFLYEELDKPIGDRLIPMVRVLPDRGNQPFMVWTANPDKVSY